MVRSSHPMTSRGIRLSRPRFALVLAALLPLSAALAADQAPAPSTPVSALIRQLGDDSWKLRQKAQDQLVRMGYEVHDELVQALKVATDEEVRARIEAIIRQVDEARATGTSFITLHAKGAAPRDVFSEISRQADTTVRTVPGNLWDSRTFEPHDFDLDHVPFWVAMKEACSAFGVMPQVNGMDRDLLIGDRNNGVRILGQAPCTVSGPFMVCAVSVNRRDYVDLNQPKNIQRNCSVQLMVLAEPKIKVLQGSWAASIEEAVDDKGNSIATPPAGNEGLMTPGNTWMWNMSCNLLPKPGGGEKIARLKGSGHFLVQTRSEVVEIDNVLSAHNVTRSIGARQLTLREVTRSGGDAWVAHLVLEGWNPGEWNLMFNNTIKMVDAKGNALVREVPNMSGGAANGRTVELKVPFKRTMWNNGEIAADPAKLIWEVPVESREVTVPFEFTDLPLP